MAVPALLMAAGTLFGAYGQYQAGEESAAVAKYNQQVKEREAQAAEQRSLIESRKQARAAARKMSELQAGLGASGALTTSGAPLKIMSEQAKESELENLEIGLEGSTEAQRLRSEGKMLRREGESQRRASRISAGSTLLTGFSSIF
jgi:hypothetical protein